MSWPSRTFCSAPSRTEAVLQDQWMDLSLPYWEGAVDVSDAVTGEAAGRGYLEMVRQ
jgi:predicted secreted hydrolase